MPLTKSQLKLKTELNKLNHKNRQSIFIDHTNFNEPQSFSSDNVIYQNILVKRKRIILLTKGCSVATCSMCHLPNEALEKRSSISDENIINQINKAFQDDDINQYAILTIYHNGNFFADCEISEKIREHIYNLVNQSNIKQLVVESLPQFITDSKLNIAKSILKNKDLGIAIGLQSSNLIIRELAINSTCSITSFEKAISIIKQYNFTPLCFLMIKPPFLTESEAIIDTVNSVKYLESLGILDPTLCPTTVSKNTIVDLLYESNLFIPPKLISIIKILQIIKKNNSKSKARVAISLLKNNDNILIKTNACTCTNDLILKIESFNLNQDITLLNTNDCPNCQNLSDNPLFDNLSIEDRISNFLIMINNSH